MKKYLLILTAVALSSCAMIPSKWDPNESKSITDIQYSADTLDCKTSVHLQTTMLKNEIQWFQIYTKTKGSDDMLKLSDTLAKTVSELDDKAAKGPVNPVYCELKKKIIQHQADVIATTVQGRF